MIVTYLRSSSYGAWDWCPHRYWLEYVLGVKAKQNVAADKGNVTHKALEMLARKKLAMQRKQQTFTDDDTGREFSVKDFGPEEAIDFGWWFYTDHRKAIHNWGLPDKEDCRKWMQTVLDYNDGQFSPLKRKIVVPEQYFDLEIDEPWANYEYTLPNGEKLAGKLSIKGTVDLITEAAPDTLEYLDWKTGRRMDWATRKVKDYDDLRDDPQMRMYHYALTRLYPNYKHIIMTIFFTKDGGPYSLCFDESDVQVTLNMLKKRFEEIRDCTQPKLNASWKTCGLCSYNDTRQTGTMKSQCQYFQQELMQLGMEKVMQKHSTNNSFANYGDGGGRINNE
jgi:hypothetical protein